ncbi:MAG: hypothetical protein ABH824_05475 [Nanoarchaeota archaeon]|nr:hypothetical protein [Nanoarchaeota archaeon]MBU1632699.1 hypothetical protein [Nanoarchaeota archaeon]MBU1876275.1 hypothetical protein [Nanoarchaeota archaeon]
MNPIQINEVIYSNEWRYVNVREIHECFERLVEDDFSKIKPGDTLWKDSEPSAGGKVYGYHKIEVTSVDGLVIHHERGMATLGLSLIYRLTDPDKLKALVDKHGDKITKVH